MNLEKNREEQYCLMGLASILLKKPVSWLSLFVPPLLHILGLRFLHLLITSAALFLSTFFFQVSLSPSIQSSKPYHDQDQEQEQEHEQAQAQEQEQEQEKEKEQKQEQEKENEKEQEQEQEQDRDYVAIKDFAGESEDNLETTIGEVRDDTIPDDESLIELSLPSGHYIGHNYYSNKNNLYIHKVQEFKLFDLFTEFNDFIEEDNLIEIDISIGSIKYSRFQIKA